MISVDRRPVLLSRIRNVEGSQILRFDSRAGLTAGRLQLVPYKARACGHERKVAVVLRLEPNPLAGPAQGIGKIRVSFAAMTTLLRLGRCGRTRSPRQTGSYSHSARPPCAGDLWTLPGQLVDVSEIDLGIHLPAQA